MASRTDITPARIDKTGEHPVNYAHDNSHRYTKRQSPPEDLIVSLADAYENCRARQVTEWEHMRRYNGARDVH